ncbi:DUF4135 domain-containing protein [Fluoribacter gormanii]|uniref:DUF4135 domain-containing protein n=1 Tax=Fluoribacter gormanii TaxID=464 RepID=UPI0010415A60|nr:DUF4135 domain-containing protein [Fluoribacter gormanii]
MRARILFESKKLDEIEAFSPDARHVSAYAVLLRDLVQQLEKYFVKDEKTLKTYALQFFEPQSKIFTLDKKSLSLILEHLAGVMDQHIVSFIEYDLKHYREQEYGIPVDADYRTINKIMRELALNRRTEKKTMTENEEDAYFDFFLKEELKKYYAQRNDFSEYFAAHYPQMEQSLRQIQQDAIRNIEKMLQRIEQDFPLLEKGFLSHMIEPKLVGITPSGSDMHKQGQQVYFLTFRDKDEIELKIVYKPTSVQADTMLVGDVKKLKDLDASYEGHESLAELFNRRALETIPTYLILPRTDDPASESVTQHYGYIEFLPSQSHLDYDMATKAGRTKFNEALSLAALDENSSCILRTEKEAQQFSYIMGMTTLLIQSVSGSDFHHENLIVSRKKPTIIDAECIFNPLVTPTFSGCSFLFQPPQGPLTGAISPFSMNCETHYYHSDMNNKIEGAREFTAKNRAYYYDADTQQLTSYVVDQESFMAGYRHGLNVITEDNDFLAWFDQEKVREMCIRILPFATQDFGRQNIYYCSQNFSYDSFKEYADKKLKTGLQAYQDDLSQYDKIQSQKEDKCVKEEQCEARISRYLPVMPLPKAVIYSDENNHEGELLKEAASASIPYYCTRADDLQLYDFKGKPIFIPLKFFMAREEVFNQEYGEGIGIDANAFFMKSPLDFARERAAAIVRNQELRELMCEDAQNNLVLLHAGLDYHIQLEAEYVVSMTVQPQVIANNSFAGG